jgi:hypothetical protein
MTDLDIERLARAFEDTSLPKEEWTHAAHVLVALRCVRLHGAEAAASRLRDAIRRFNAAKGGAPTAYHETITLAWIEALSRFLAAEDRGEPLSALAAAALSRMGDKLFLLRFYSRDRLMSDEARARFVPPDLRGFDDAPAGEGVRPSVAASAS